MSDEQVWKICAYILTIISIVLIIIVVTTNYEHRSVRVITSDESGTRQRCVSCENVALYTGSDQKEAMGTEYCPYCGRKFTKTIAED